MTTIYKTACNGPRVFDSAELADGDTAIMSLCQNPSPQGTSLSIVPADGATATVSVTLSAPSKVKAGTAIWHTALIGTAGVVSAKAMDVLDTPVTAIKVVATGGAVEVEVVQ